jgi:putative Ig domain-containing protein
MMEERAGSAAVQLNDGRVIAAGGDQHSGATLSSIEIYDPTTAAFHAAGEMTVPRGGIAAAHLSDDSALFVGGFGASAASWSSAELFAPDRLLLLGRLNTAYASSIPARGTSPFAFTLKAGALPPGVELDASTGALRGTPTQAGLFTFVVAIADASTPSRQTLFDGTIQVGEAPASRALNIVEAGVAFIDRSTATLTVQLEESEAPAPAPAGGFDVLLASSNPACVSVQTTATIPAGQSAVAVTVAPGGTAPLPCTSVVTVSGTQAAGDLVNVTVTPPTAPRPNPTGPGTTMVSFFNPAPVVGGPQRQQGTFASVSYSSPISGQQTPVVTRASTTSVSFFNPAATAQPTPAVRNSLTMLSYFNPAPVFTAVQRQVATFASVSFSNPTPAQQTPTVVSRASTTSVSFFNPAPISQPTAPAAVRSGMTTLSFFNPAPIQQPTVAATMRSGLTTLSFFNPAPLPTTQTVRAGAAAAPAVSFANGASSVGGAGTIALRAGGTLDALRFAAGPTITEISPAVLSLSAPVPTLVITGANLFGVTDVTFSDPTGITIGAISASPDGRTLSIPIALAPTTPLATIAIVVTGATGSSPITDQTVVTIVP